MCSVAVRGSRRRVRARASVRIAALPHAISAKENPSEDSREEPR